MPPVTPSAAQGVFLRGFQRGHVRLWDRMSRELLVRACAFRAGPSAGPLIIDLDSTCFETRGLKKQVARWHSY